MILRILRYPFLIHKQWARQCSESKRLCSDLSGTSVWSRSDHTKSSPPRPKAHVAKPKPSGERESRHAPSSARWLFIGCTEKERRDFLVWLREQNRNMGSFLLNRNVWDCLVYELQAPQRAPRSLRGRFVGTSGPYQRDRSSFWIWIGGSCGCGAELLFCCGNPEGVRQLNYAATARRTITAEIHFTGLKCCSFAPRYSCAQKKSHKNANKQTNMFWLSL